MVIFVASKDGYKELVNADAQVWLGLLYSLGAGVVKDNKVA
jgi:hypothetical protein